MSFAFFDRMFRWTLDVLVNQFNFLITSCELKFENFHFVKTFCSFFVVDEFCVFQSSASMNVWCTRESIQFFNSFMWIKTRKFSFRQSKTINFNTRKNDCDENNDIRKNCSSLFDDSRFNNHFTIQFVCDKTKNTKLNQIKFRDALRWLNKFFENDDD